MTKSIKFGIIGGGLMGREFASAAARWCHLLDLTFGRNLLPSATRTPRFTRGAPTTSRQSAKQPPTTVNFWRRTKSTRSTAVPHTCTPRFTRRSFVRGNT